MKSLYLSIQNNSTLNTSEQISEDSLDTPEARKSYRLTLLDAYPLLLNFYDEILNTPELYSVEIKTTWFGTVVTGNTSLFLGDFLQFWQDEPWHRNCPTCHTQTLFIFGAGGSPLSGSGGGGGICTKCKETFSGVGAFMPFFSSVRKIYALSRKAEGASIDSEAPIFSRKLKKSSITLEQVLAGVKQCTK